MQFLVKAKLLDDSRVVSERDDSVNTLSRISPGLVRWQSLGENPLVEVLVLFVPSASLLWRAFVTGARFALVRQKAERPCDRRAVARQTEDDWRLLGAVEGNKKMPPRVVDNLSKFVRGARAWSEHKWR